MIVSIGDVVEITDEIGISPKMRGKQADVVSKHFVGENLRYWLRCDGIDVLAFRCQFKVLERT